MDLASEGSRAIGCAAELKEIADSLVRGIRGADITTGLGLTLLRQEVADIIGRIHSGVTLLSRRVLTKRCNAAEVLILLLYELIQKLRPELRQCALSISAA